MTKYFQFSGNTVSVEITSGVTTSVSTLFYRPKTSETEAVFCMEGNVFNAVGNALNTSGADIYVLKNANTAVKAFIRNNIFRKIYAITDDTATIAENRNNFFGDLPAVWDGDMSVFYGGATGQIPVKQSNNSLDIAWENTNIVDEYVSSATPIIHADANKRYKCGEVSSIYIIPPATGNCEVIFTSGATAANLIVPNCIRWEDGFDPSTLSTDTIYQIRFSDGTYGDVKKRDSILDTSPIIAETGKYLTGNDSTAVDQDWCYTEWIILNPPVNPNNAMTTRDANASLQGSPSKVYQGQTEDGSSKDYWYGSTDFTEKARSWTAKQWFKLRWSIRIDKVDDAYAICNGTGQILFAGKNTQYYGYTNVNDMPS